MKPLSILSARFGRAGERRPQASSPRPSGFFATLSRLPAKLALLLSALVLLARSTPLNADERPPGCTGSALGINLFTDSRNVHIGETITYSVTVFNGLPGSPEVACDASDIVAWLVTPDGVTNRLTLRRTELSQGQSDFYPNVVSYVVRAQDIFPDGTVRAAAYDEGDIHQNDIDSRGGGNQSLNSQVIQPCIAVNAICVGGVGQFGAITFTGTVRNCGNAPLESVTVTNFVNGQNVRVIGPITLAIGQEVPFQGSWVPANACAPSTATFTASGMDNLTIPRTVTATSSTTCANELTPSIQVTKVCPPTPVRPGQTITYSGTVTNTGNVTLTNVTVVADQPANTTVFTVASLAPGAGASFTGSYVAPVDCSTTSGVVARGTSVCGVTVTDSASSTCPVLTTPQIAVTTVCATNVAVPGGTQTYTGTVRNTGDVPLRNIVIVSDRPSTNTTIFTIASLAPGASADFSGSYAVPALNACAVTTTVVASGIGSCSDTPVTATSSVTCGVATTPQVAVTLICPAGTLTPGASAIYTGTVSNPGNVTLQNVTVRNGNDTVLTIASLNPGASTNFSTTVTVPVSVCAVSATVTASGADACAGTVVNNSASVTCPVVTAPALEITQSCPTAPLTPGALLTYTGTVRNSGNVTVTNVVVVNSRGGSTPVLTVASLAPGATANFTGSYTAPVDTCSVSSTSTVTATSVCGVAVTQSASSTCTILTAPAIAVTTACPTNVIAPGGTVTFTGTVRNSGNITLSNVVVVSDRPSAGTVIFTAATLAPGASANFTGSYTAPATFPQGGCGVSATVVATGRDLCTGNAVTNSATANCTVTTAPAIAVTLACPPASVAPGAPITYTGTVRNSGNVTLVNVTVVNTQSSPSTVLTVASLAPGASTNFTSTVTTPADACAVTASVTASGNDICTSTPVTASQSATCTLLTTPAIDVTQVCPPNPTAPGGLYTYTGTVRNTGNITLTNVVVFDSRNGGATVTTNVTYWVDDAVPAGAQQGATGGDAWTFVGANPAPFHGTLAHQSNIGQGLHQHYFVNAAATLSVGTGDVLIAYVYLDPANPPSEVMLQWNDGSWEHRAYWGQNLIVNNAGVDGTSSRRFMGALPATGQWVRLEVPAASVGLENRTLNGMSFILFGGRATWDATGKYSVATNPGSPAQTQVFTVASLAPGQSASFTGSYTLPADGACSVTTTLTARGNDKCTGVAVTDTATSTCPIITTPGIEVTQTCPAAPGVQGQLLTFTGTVRNTGNITLSNVVVYNSRTGTNAILTLASLAPGATADFTGSYRVPVNCCTVSSTSTAAGANICTGEVVTDTTTSTCPVQSTPAIVVTKLCPTNGIVEPGDTLRYTGTVGNTGDITLYDVYVYSDRTPGVPVYGPAVLAPGETVTFRGSYLVPADFCAPDTLTARGTSICEVAVTNTATTTCPIVTTPEIEVTKNCPVNPPTFGGLYEYTGTVRNVGNVTLVDVYVYNTRSSNTAPVLGPITLAPGQAANFSDSFIAPRCCCEITDTVVARGRDRCSGITVTDSASTVCPLLTTPSLSIAKFCPTATVPVGGTYSYSGVATNTGDVNLVNVFVYAVRGGVRTPILGPFELAPGETVRFNDSYTVGTNSSPSSDIVEITGVDTCQARTVLARATCSGPAGPDGDMPVVRSVVLSGDTATITWSGKAGMTYKVQWKGSVGDTNWTDVPGNVTATGNTVIKSDLIGTNMGRFYRVVTVE